MNKKYPPRTQEISIPLGIAEFPDEYHTLFSHSETHTRTKEKEGVGYSGARSYCHNIIHTFINLFHILYI